MDTVTLAGQIIELHKQVSRGLLDIANEIINSAIADHAPRGRVMLAVSTDVVHATEELQKFFAAVPLTAGAELDPLQCEHIRRLIDFVNAIKDVNANAQSENQV